LPASTRSRPHQHRRRQHQQQRRARQAGLGRNAGLIRYTSAAPMPQSSAEITLPNIGYSIRNPCHIRTKLEKHARTGLQASMRPLVSRSAHWVRWLVRVYRKRARLRPMIRPLSDPAHCVSWINREEVVRLARSSAANRSPRSATIPTNSVRGTCAVCERHIGVRPQ
jgi:hypothetical protein